MKSKLRYFIFFINFFFQLQVSFAQQQPELRFHKIPDELLQGAEIEKFFITRDGCLWLGTSQGLASFDGSEMTYYGNKGLQGTANYRVADLCEDSNGNLWMITPEHGVLSFNRKTGVFKRTDISINEKIKSSQIQFAKIFIDRQGIVWVGSWGQGLFKYNPLSNTCEHYNIRNDTPPAWQSSYVNTVRNIIQDKNDDNILWLACYGSGIYSFNKVTKKSSKKFKYYNIKDTCWQASAITSLCQVSDSIIWYSTWGFGMCEYNIKTGVYYSYQRNSGYRFDVYPNGHVLEYFAQKSDSEFYVAPRDTIPAVFNIHTKQFSFIDDDELKKEFKKTQNVKSGFKDEVYYEKGGALFVSSPRFKLFRNINLGDKKNNVYPEMRCITWDAAHQNYYAGILLGEGVNVYDKDFKLLWKIAMPSYSGQGFAKATTIWKLHHDKSNHLWALGFVTCVYDSASLRFIPVAIKWPQLKLLDSAMYDVAEDRNGMLYFSSLNNEFIRLNPFTLEEEKLPLPGTNKEGYFSFYSNPVLSDSTRQFIYFTNNKNLYQYSTANKKFKSLYVDPTYYTNPIEKHDCSYMVDHAGFVWLSTPDHHLWKIDPDKFEITDTIKFNNSRVDLTGAHLYGAWHEYLLISTGKSQLLYNTKNRESVYLNRNNGLLLNQGSKEMLCNDNLFFNYSGAGIAQYASINNLIQPSKKITPYLTFILINNRPVVSDTLPQYLKNLKLDYTSNTISIGFSSIETQFPDRLEYAYKLEKADKDWSYTNNVNRRINYANLAPGKYIFKVKVREWGLNWSLETQLLIAITPPFWRRWWFIVLVIISSAALLFWFGQWRINSIRRQEVLRTKHEKELLELEAKALNAQMNPHFIFNCMNSIKSLIQKNEKTQAITYLTTFSKLIRTIFNNSDEREITLYDELETCKLYTQLESMRLNNKFTYDFKVDGTIDIKSVRIPALIIQPFIENAIWHGIMPKEAGGILIVTVDKIGDTLRCIIDDNGIGRNLSTQIKSGSESAPHKSKGVRLTQSRLQLDNMLNERKASVEIIDKKDGYGRAAGTRIIIQLTEY
ncbi:MAG: histidine kinase [Ginsengibacter sp.]